MTSEAAAYRPRAPMRALSPSRDCEADFHISLTYEGHVSRLSSHALQTDGCRTAQTVPFLMNLHPLFALTKISNHFLAISSACPGLHRRFWQSALVTFLFGSRKSSSSSCKVRRLESGRHTGRSTRRGKPRWRCKSQRWGCSRGRVILL